MELGKKVEGELSMPHVSVTCFVQLPKRCGTSSMIVSFGNSRSKLPLSQIQQPYGGVEVLLLVLSGTMPE